MRVEEAVAVYIVVRFTITIHIDLVLGDRRDAITIIVRIDEIKEPITISVYRGRRIAAELISIIEAIFIRVAALGIAPDRHLEAVADPVAIGVGVRAVLIVPVQEVRDAILVGISSPLSSVIDAIAVAVVIQITGGPVTIWIRVPLVGVADSISVGVGVEIVRQTVAVGVAHHLVTAENAVAIIIIVK